MFAKTFLSIIGLLFASTQINFASADYNSCQPTYNVDTPSCTPGTCTSGDDGFYLAKDTGELVEVTNSENTAECALVSKDGYYLIKDGTSFKSKKDSTIGDADQDAENDCSGESDAGKLSTDRSKFCLAKDKALTLTDTKSYMYTDVGSIFTDADNENVIVKSNGSSINIDSDLMNHIYNYCVDSNMAVWDRKADLCNGSKADGECTYYSCDGSKCTVNDENLVKNEERVLGVTCDLNNPDSEKCVDGGYYLFVTSDSDKSPVKATSTTGPYTMVKCVDSGGWDCTTVPFIGYVKNAAKDPNDATEDAAYIKCELDGTCTPVGDIETGLASLSTGATHLVSIESGALLGIGQESGKYVVIRRETDSAVTLTITGNGYMTTTTSQLIVQNTSAGDLYYCTNESGKYAKCESATKPIGYVVNVGDDTTNYPYIKCDATTACTAYQLATNCDTAGELNSPSDGVIKLCGVQSNSADLILTGAGAASGDFFTSVQSTDLFGIVKQNNYYIVLKFADGNIIVDKTQTRYRYTLTSEKTKIYPRASAASENDGAEKICFSTDNTTFNNVYEYILVNWSGAPAGLTDGVAYYVTQDFTK